jgi:hypothetical protein
VIVRNDHAVQVAANTLITNSGPGSLKVGTLAEIAVGTAATVASSTSLLVKVSSYCVSVSSSEVTFAAGNQSFRLPGGPSLFIGATDPGTAAADGDVWIDTT